ncbi:MAG: dCTP deaminase [Nitrospirae bacterium]|nr:MAG: dCTP deaminase [Nitrospirota bacterium]
MSLKPDRWIARMAREHGLIEPFEEGQVRKGVVSYGVSSYGYDIRVADEFKIFTNVNSSIVDPKAFDPASFVDVKTDVCIVPPNSFALAHTVEYFRIPRNVLAICLGKSTYARCFRGDTRVALVDGTAPTLEEMARRAEEGEAFWGYSIGPYGRLLVTHLEAPRFIGRDALLEVELDNGERIHCTPDHRFLLRDGRMVEAAALRPGTSLMPLYRQVVRGYEEVYQPLDGHLVATHRLADEWNLRHGIYEDLPGTHRHHLDGDRRNNRPWNLVRMEAKAHVRLHNAATYGAEFDAEGHAAAIRDALARRAEDPSWQARYRELQRQRARRFWHEDRYEATRRLHRAAMVARYRDPNERALQAERIRRAWANDDGSRRARQAEVARSLRLRPEITEEVVRGALDEAGSIRGAARLLGCDRSVFRRFPEAVRSFRGRTNHKVAAIRELPGDHDVYCLTVPEAGNFALEAGVFVHNCGIIVNVTPFEPGWEGYVTIEISNTTPLPAKIYANEGIAQVLFFEADEECAVSYADRKGKYQGQTGVTLPRI